MDNLKMHIIKDDDELNIDQCYKNEFQNSSNFFSKFFSLNRKKNDESLDRVQKINRNSLFSALVSKPTSDCDALNFYLDIPDLPEDTDLVTWQIPTTSSFEWIDYEHEMKFDKAVDTSIMRLDTVTNNDEGFCSNKCSPLGNSQKRDQLWEFAAKYSISDYMDWDMKSTGTFLINGMENDSKNYLLIDSPSHLFDQFYYNYLNTVNILIDNQSSSVNRCLISEMRFLRDCLYLLLSVPSLTFIWDENKFKFNECFHVSGYTSECLSSFARDYVQVGTLHRKLLDYVNIPKRDGRCGAVFRSFANAIREYLNYYTRAILDNFDRLQHLTIVSFDSTIKPLIHQFKYLCELCKLDAMNKSATGGEYLKGVDLIFYLFSTAKTTINNSINFQLLLHLLSFTLVPLFNFIENWAFKGIHEDLFDEFFIDKDHKWINSRDKNYYLKAYNLKEKFKNIDEEDYCLIKHLYADIFESGKSLALLKRCDPNHFLFNEEKSVYPKLIVNFNQTYLQQIDIICDAYNRMSVENSKYGLKSRSEYLFEKNKIYQEKLTLMKREANERFELYNEKLKQERRQDYERKKKELDKLKQQMEDDLKRRLEEKLREKREDKEYMQKLLNRDFELTERQRQLEQQLKDEITQEYAALIKQAEEREAAARVRIEKAVNILTNNVQEETQSATQVTLNANQLQTTPEIADSSVINASQTEQPTENRNEPKMDDEPRTKQDEDKEGDKKSATRRRVNEQTVEKDYKPSIKIVRKETTGSGEPDSAQSSIDSRVEAFKARNKHGRHSTDSHIQELMYAAPKSQRRASKITLNDDEMSELDREEKLKSQTYQLFTQVDTRVSKIDFNEIIKPYNTNINEETFNGAILTSLVDYTLVKPLQPPPHTTLFNYDNENKKYEFQIENESNTSALYSFNYIEIEELLNRILYKPIKLQLSIVNRSLINYIMFDLNLDENLKALRKYLLFENGIFAQTFVDELFNLFENSAVCNYGGMQLIKNPLYLNDVLNKACLLIKDDKYVENLSIRINQNRSAAASRQHAHTTGVDSAVTSTANRSQLLDYLNDIQLVYKLDWPLNTIVSDECILNYNRIFSFLLKIKFVLSALNNIWHALKRHELINNLTNSNEIKTLKLFCHEMQHYIVALQNYICNQIIQVAWQDLEKSLNEANSLDDLIQSHIAYLKNCLAKCFFAKKAESVHNVIINIFEIIMKFRNELVNNYLPSESMDASDVCDKHSTRKDEAYEELIKIHTDFKSNSTFLFKVLRKLVSIGYELHLNNLSLTLNYNFYYGNETSLK